MLTQPTILPDDEVLSVYGAAKELGVAAPTFRNWCFRGLIPARDAAGRLIVRREDLERLKAERAGQRRSGPAPSSDTEAQIP